MLRDRQRHRGPTGILRWRIEGRVPREQENLRVSWQLDRTAVPESDGVRRYNMGPAGDVGRFGIQLAEPEGVWYGHDNSLRHDGDGDVGADGAQEGAPSEGGIQAGDVWA